MLLQISINRFSGSCAWAFVILLAGASFLSGCASSRPHHATVTSYPSRHPGSALTAMLPPPSGAVRDIYHEVGPYDSIWAISKTYSVDSATIMRVNRISDPRQIKKGMKLLIPNTRGPRANIPLFPTTRWTNIVIHHTATDQGSAFSIDSLHIQRGWDKGMGYDFLIDNGTRGKMMGQIEVGPRWKKQMDGAHTKQGDWNKKAIGICVVGNYSETGLPDKMFDSLVFLVVTLQNFYRIPDQNVVGHRDVPGAATECPGKFFPWSEFKRRVRAF